MSTPEENGMVLVGYLDPRDNDVMPLDLCQGLETDPAFKFTVPVYADPAKLKES